MSFTAADATTSALRLLGLLDLYETANAAQIALGVDSLRKVLLSLFSHGEASHLMFEADATVQARTQEFVIGTASPAYQVQVDARKVQSIFLGYTSATRFELSREPINKIRRVASVSTLPVRFFTQDQVDGSIRVVLWPTPASPVALHIVGFKRQAVPTAADGSDVLQVPPDAELAISYLLAAFSRPLYGVPATEVADVLRLAQQATVDWQTTGRQNTSIQLRRG